MTAEVEEAGGGAAARLFAALLAAAALLLLALVGEETQWVGGLRVAAQPRMLPLLALAGVLVFAASAAFVLRGDVRQVKGEAVAWLRPAEYLAYFMLYVGAARWAGYGFATVLFCPLLAWRAGCGLRQRAFAAAFGLGVVLFFKGALSVKIPGGAWYDSLPPAVRSFLILNF